MTADVISFPKRQVKWKPLTEVEHQALDTMAQDLQEEALVGRAWKNRSLSSQPAERDSSDVVVDVTPEGRAAWEEQQRELVAAEAANEVQFFSSRISPWSICPKCGGTRSAGGGPHAPRPRAVIPGAGPAMVDCVGDVIDPWPPARMETIHGP